MELADTTDGFNFGGTREERRLEIFCLKDNTSHHNCLNLGSNLSRSQSPRKFPERTTNPMAIPGNVEIHQAVSTRFLPSLIILPQDGAGGGIPTPRKLKEASVIINKPT